MKVKEDKITFFEHRKKVAIAFVLILTIAATLVVAMPSAYAANHPTYSTLSVNPNPVGVGQTIVINYQLNFPLSGRTYSNLTIRETKPDGTTETYVTPQSNTNGGYTLVLVFQTTGNYTFQGSYAGETWPDGTVVLASQTPKTILVVQQEPIPGWPEQPFPTDYWTRPINSQNRNWANLAANWLMPAYNTTGHYYSSAACFNAYTTAPKTAHIMWMAPYTMGGLAGATTAQGADWGFWAGGNYATPCTPPVIINGYLYYEPEFSSSGNQGPKPGVICRNLRTGQIVWQNNTMMIDFGQLLKATTLGAYGYNALLWSVSSSTWRVYDAYSGKQLYTFTGGRSVGRTSQMYKMDPDTGELNVWYIGGRRNATTGGYNVWVAMWNSSRYSSFRPSNIANTGIPIGTAAWTTGIQWNVTNFEPFNWDAPPSGNPTAIVGDVIVGEGATVSGTQKTLMQGYSTKTGKLLWYHNETFFGGISSRFAMGEGLYIQVDPALMVERAFDVQTGRNVWNSDPTVYPWGQYMTYGAVAGAYGLYYVGGYDGYMHAFNLKTGKEVWKFFSGNSGTETPYGTWPFFNGPIVADGLVIGANMEHSPNQPLYRGEKVYAIDAFKGKNVWNLTGFWDLMAVADGYLVAANQYDNQIYVIGKGPSATTVSAPQNAVALGSSVLITGTVTDQSPGQQGTPCIADADMSKWMEYIHGMATTYSTPPTVSGVPVQLLAMSSNGTMIPLGTVWSDVSGTFAFWWTPPSRDMYKITAYFGGSQSYGSSWAETALAVDPAPAAPPTPETSGEIASATLNSITPILVVLAVAIILVAVLVIVDIVMQRRRK